MASPQVSIKSIGMRHVEVVLTMDVAALPAGTYANTGFELLDALTQRLALQSADMKNKGRSVGYIYC